MFDVPLTLRVFAAYLATLAVGVFESGCGVWTGWALRRSRAALVVVGALAIVTGAGGVEAADSYRFRWSESGPLPKALQGVVLSDGERYRVDHEKIAGADPEPSDVTLRSSEKSPEVFMNTELRTHFAAVHDPWSAKSPIPRYLGLVPIPMRLTIRETAFQCESNSPPASSPAGDDSERLVRLSVAYEATIDVGGSPVVGDLAIEASYRTLPTIRVPIPEFFRPRIRTTDDSLDARIATCLARVEGLPKTYELRVKRSFHGGVTDSYEQNLRVEDHRQVAAVDPAKFKIPSNYRYKAPEMAAPGN